MRGYVFVVQADVTTITCNAWLCPTDEVFSVTRFYHGYEELAGRDASRIALSDLVLEPMSPARDREVVAAAERLVGIAYAPAGSTERGEDAARES